LFFHAQWQDIACGLLRRCAGTAPFYCPKYPTIYYAVKQNLHNYFLRVGRPLKTPLGSGTRQSTAPGIAF